MYWLLALIGLLLLVTVFMAAVTHLFFLYEYGNGDYAERYDDSMDIAPTIVRGVITSLLAQAAVFSTFPLFVARRLIFPDKPPSAGSLPPVILVHGLYHNAAAWLFHSIALRRKGFPVYVYTYNSWTRNYYEARDGLTKRVEEIRTLTGDRRVFLIGHSLGGLLIRGYLSRPRSHGKVRAAVTLGSPHQGSKLAVLGLGTMARSLSYRGALIRELEATDHPPDCPCLALYSPSDNFVLPREGLFIHLENWTLQEVTPPISHVAMLWHAPTMDRAVSFLKRTL